VDGRGTGEWNFGPGRESFVPVRRLADLAVNAWGDGARWTTDSLEHPHEAALLSLDATKAERELGWRNRLPFPLSLDWTINWERRVIAGEDVRSATIAQLEAFLAL
jgi:CDP-glucose 4,6-dehydratase